MSQIIAIGTALANANHNPSVTKQIAMIVTIIRFMTFVANGGFLSPNTVGNMAGINASWQTAITTSCHAIII